MRFLEELLGLEGYWGYIADFSLLYKIVLVIPKCIGEMTGWVLNEYPVEVIGNLEREVLF